MSLLPTPQVHGHFNGPGLAFPCFLDGDSEEAAFPRRLFKILLGPRPSAHSWGAPRSRP